MKKEHWMKVSDARDDIRDQLQMMQQALDQFLYAGKEIWYLRSPMRYPKKATIFYSACQGTIVEIRVRNNDNNAYKKLCLEDIITEEQYAHFGIKED